MPDVPGVSNFPGGLDTSVSLIQVKDLASTTLDAPGINSTATTIPAVSTSNFPSSGAITIEGEHITYTGKTASSFTGCARGQFTALGGSTNAAHTTGVTINQLVIAATHQVHSDAIVNTQTKLGSGASVPSAGTFLKGTGPSTSAWGALTSGEIATALGFTPGQGIGVQIGDATVVSQALIADFDANYFSATESPAGEANITFADPPVKDVGTLTISGGVVTLPAIKGNAAIVVATIDTEGAAALDDLDNIAITGSIPSGTQLILKSLSGGRVSTVKHDPTKISLDTSLNFALASTFHRIILLRSGTIWVEASRQPNGIGSVLQPWDADLDALAATPTNYLQPPGAIVMYGGASAPTGWLLCNGAAVSRATYAALFAILGTAYGVGDGSTTFNLPDLRDRVPMGKGVNAVTDTLGETGGLATVTLTAAQSGLPAHTHSASSGTESAVHNHNYQDIYVSTNSITGFQSGGQSHTSQFGSDQTRTSNTENQLHTHGITVSANSAAAASSSHENLPPYQVFNCIIKT